MIYVSEHHEVLARLGFEATASADDLQNRNVAIVVDADARERGEEMARSLDGVAASVRIIDLGDVASWFANDRAGVNLAKLARTAPLFKPDDSSDTGSTDDSAHADGTDTSNDEEDDDGGDDGGDDGNADELLIAELAALNPLTLQYAKRKKEVATQLGIPVADLDKIVAKERHDAEDREQAAPLYDDWNVEAWGEPVDGDVLLQNIIAVLRRYVAMSEDQALVVALWIIFTWLHETAATHSPILLVTSPQENSGKSTLLEIVGFLSRRSISSVLITGPVLFRTVDRWLPTFIVDEADTAFIKNDDLKELFNVGWTRGRSKVMRCDGKTYEPRPFSVFCPKAIGMIGRALPRATLSRCLTIAMQRKKPDEITDDFDYLDNDDFARLRSQIMRFATDNAEALAKAKPETPPGFHNRLRQNWRLLFAIADLVGWGQAARDAALDIEQVAAASDPSIPVQLLSDIRDVFDRLGAEVPTKTLIPELAKDMEGPWLAYNKGEPITDRQLARLLRDFNHGLGIRSKDLRVGGVGGIKGYKRADFEGDFAAYLAPVAPKTPLRCATPLQVNTFNDLGQNLSATSLSDVADKNASNPLEPNNCSGVADERPVFAATAESGAVERCAQCHGEVDGEERLRMIDGAKVWLHPQCERFYIADRDEDLPL